MQDMDSDANGCITLEEFKQWWLVAEERAHHHKLLGIDIEDSVLALKHITAQPLLIFYHLFVRPVAAFSIQCSSTVVNHSCETGLQLAGRGQRVVRHSR
eukprot:SAG11_NODE_21439_length_425_cov_0.634969_1_plen_99_part_00